MNESCCFRAACDEPYEDIFCRFAGGASLRGVPRAKLGEIHTAFQTEDDTDAAGGMFSFFKLVTMIVAGIPGQPLCDLKEGGKDAESSLVQDCRYVEVKR